jgi:hypothetical protein
MGPSAGPGRQHHYKGRRPSVPRAQAAGNRRIGHRGGYRRGREDQPVLRQSGRPSRIASTMAGASRLPSASFPARTIKPRGAGQSGRITSSSITTKLTWAGTMPLGNSRDSFQKSFVRGSDHSAMRAENFHFPAKVSLDAKLICQSTQEMRHA